MSPSKYLLRFVNIIIIIFVILLIITMTSIIDHMLAHPFYSGSSSESFFIYHLLCNIFSPSGKVASSEKTTLTFWDNNFLIKQITIYIKMSGCKFRGHTK